MPTLNKVKTKEKLFDLLNILPKVSSYHRQFKVEKSVLNNIM